MKNSDSQVDILFWTAFRYVAGELSTEESAAFEARLADDLSAQEAVVRAVRLTSAVFAAIDSELVESPKPARLGGSVALPADGTTQRRSWVATAMALACLILSALVVHHAVKTPRGESIEVVGLDAATSSAGDLVSLWTSADSTDNAARDRADELFDAESDDNARNELFVPDWVIAAVEADIQSGSTDGEESNEL